MVKKEKGSSVDYGKLTAEALNKAFGPAPAERESAPEKQQESSKTGGKGEK
jgi:hypothetical protein